MHATITDTHVNVQCLIPREYSSLKMNWTRSIFGRLQRPNASKRPRPPTPKLFFSQTAPSRPGIGRSPSLRCYFGCWCVVQMQYRVIFTSPYSGRCRCIICVCRQKYDLNNSAPEVFDARYISREIRGAVIRHSQQHFNRG